MFERKEVRRENARIDAAGCYVTHVSRAGLRVLHLPLYPPLIAVDPLPNVPPDRCLYYVRASICSTPEGRPACDALERRLTFVDMARATFPARPSFRKLDYDRPQVDCFLARVVRVLQ